MFGYKISISVINIINYKFCFFECCFFVERIINKVVNEGIDIDKILIRYFRYGEVEQLVNKLKEIRNSYNLKINDTEVEKAYKKSLATNLTEE